MSYTLTLIHNSNGVLVCVLYFRQALFSAALGSCVCTARHHVVQLSYSRSRMMSTSTVALRCAAFH